MHDCNLDLYLFHLNLKDWMNDGAGGHNCHLNGYDELLLLQTFPGFLPGRWDELIVVYLQLPRHHLRYAVDSGGNGDYVGGDGVDWAVGDDEDLALGLFDGSSLGGMVLETFASQHEVDCYPGLRASGGIC